MECSRATRSSFGSCQAHEIARGRALETRGCMAQTEVQGEGEPNANGLQLHVAAISRDG
jgi:hypothetical protein